MFLPIFPVQWGPSQMVYTVISPLSLLHIRRLQGVFPGYTVLEVHDLKPRFQTLRRKFPLSNSYWYL